MSTNRQSFVLRGHEIKRLGTTATDSLEGDGFFNCTVNTSTDHTDTMLGGATVQLLAVSPSMYAVY